MELNQYFEPELFSLSQNQGTLTSIAAQYYTTIYVLARIQMVIGILWLIMNPQCCFIQTVTGLLCYAYGLRDKGFEALNSMGCCCS